MALQNIEQLAVDEGANNVAALEVELFKELAMEKRNINKMLEAERNKSLGKIRLIAKHLRSQSMEMDRRVRLQQKRSNVKQMKKESAEIKRQKDLMHIEYLQRVREKRDSIHEEEKLVSQKVAQSRAKRRELVKKEKEQQLAKESRRQTRSMQKVLEEIVFLKEKEIELKRQLKEV